MKPNVITELQINEGTQLKSQFINIQCILTTEQLN